MNDAAEQSGQTHEEPAFPVIEFNVTEAALAELAERYKDPDASTADGYAVCKEGVKELTSIRTSIETRRKALKADALEWGRRVDRSARKLTERVRDIEQPVREAKDVVDEEQKRIAREKAEAEAQRKAEIESRIEWMRAFAAPEREADTATEVGKSIGLLEQVVVDEDMFGEYLEQARDAKEATLARLCTRLDAAVKLEEADRQRREDEERLRRERAEFEADQRKAAADRQRRTELDVIRQRPIDAMGEPTAVIERLIARTQSEDLSEERWQDRLEDAEQVVSDALTQLEKVHERAKAEDAAAEERMREAHAKATERQTFIRHLAEEPTRLEGRSIEYMQERLDRILQERPSEAFYGDMQAAAIGTWETVTAAIKQLIAEAKDREDKARRNREEAEARRPEIDKMRSWLDKIENVSQSMPDLTDPPVARIAVYAARALDRAVSDGRKQIEKLERKS